MSEHPLEGETLPSNSDEEYHSATEDTEERPDEGPDEEEGEPGELREGDAQGTSNQEGGGANVERVELSEEQMKVRWFVAMATGVLQNGHGWLCFCMLWDVFPISLGTINCSPLRPCKCVVLGNAESACAKRGVVNVLRDSACVFRI